MDDFILWLTRSNFYNILHRTQTHCESDLFEQLLHKSLLVLSVKSRSSELKNKWENNFLLMPCNLKIWELKTMFWIWILWETMNASVRTASKRQLRKETSSYCSILFSYYSGIKRLSHRERNGKRMFHQSTERYEKVWEL